jgi:hypothetical protein
VTITTFLALRIKDITSSGIAFIKEKVSALQTDLRNLESKRPDSDLSRDNDFMQVQKYAYTFVRLYEGQKFEHPDYALGKVLFEKSLRFKQFYGTSNLPMDIWDRENQISNENWRLFSLTSDAEYGALEFNAFYWELQSDFTIPGKLVVNLKPQMSDTFKQYVSKARPINKSTFTLSFNREIEELAQGKGIKFNRYNTTSLFGYIFDIHRQWIEMKVASLREKHEKSMETLSKIENRIKNMQEGNVEITEVKFPYRHRRAWAELPENSGVVRLEPYVTSAISKAYEDIKKCCTIREDIEFFQRDKRFLYTFAEIVAANINLTEIDNPTVYRDKNAKKSILLKKGAVLADFVRKYRQIKNFF